MEVDFVSSRVTVNPQVRSGQPIIGETRITVWGILGCLGGGLTGARILNDYTELTSKTSRLPGTLNVPCMTTDL